MSEYKKLYKTLLDNGELQELFPSMKGDWEQDKKQFILEQKDLEDLLKDIEINDDEY